MEEEEEVEEEEEDEERNVEVENLVKAIEEDDLELVITILNSNPDFRTNFNELHLLFDSETYGTPLLHNAASSVSIKVFKYFLLQPFVDAFQLTSFDGGNIYHTICTKRGTEELFSIINSQISPNKVTEMLKAKNESNSTPFHYACRYNSIKIVKELYENFGANAFEKTDDNQGPIQCASMNDDVEIIKYVSKIEGIDVFEEDDVDDIGCNSFLTACECSTLDVVLYLFDLYLHRSIPSDFRGDIHQYINSQPLDLFNTLNIGSDNIYDKIKQTNYKSILQMQSIRRTIWHAAASNRNIDVVQFIFSLRGITLENIFNLPNQSGDDVFTIAVQYNTDIKIIKYLHKLIPTSVNSSRNPFFERASRYWNYISEEVITILHYLYLGGTDIHYLMGWTSAFSVSMQICGSSDNDLSNYLKVISKDFDYQNNPHGGPYKKPSFWKEIDNNADEHSKRVNEWKNRFDEHVLHHFSKMIQEYMLED